jgi:hypothetical protein
VDFSSVSEGLERSPFSAYSGWDDKGSTGKVVVDLDSDEEVELDNVLA